MLASELLHRTIEWAEEIYGIAGQTKLHLVEKRKRDARILNIYEGTNEIQRFFILRDLASEIAPRWPEKKVAPAHTAREALELETAKGALRSRVVAAVDLFGQNLWQDPNLQANCFLLAEAAAWYKAADSTLGRLSWLTRRELATADQSTAANSAARPSPDGRSTETGMEIGRRAFARCIAEIRTRMRRFDEELTHLRRGYYAPEVRAASLMFDRAAVSPRPTEAASRISRALRVLVIAESVEPMVPQPSVDAERLLEPELTLSRADRSALEAALRLRDEAAAPVYIEMAAVGPRRMTRALRIAIDLGADRVRHIVCDSDAVSADEAADALATALPRGPAFDLVLGGAESGSQQGLITYLLAEICGMNYAGAGTRILVQAEGGESALSLGNEEQFEARTVPLPGAAGIRAASILRPFTVAGFLEGLGRQVEILPWPRSIKLRRAEFQRAADRAERSKATSFQEVLSPEQAASRALGELGLARGTTATSRSYEGSIADAADFLSASAGTRSVVAMVSTDDAGRLQSVARPTILAATQLAAELNRTASGPAHRYRRRVRATACGGSVVGLLPGANHDHRRRRPWKADGNRFPRAKGVLAVREEWARDSRR